MAIKYLLDTCVLDDFLRGLSPVVERLIELPTDEVVISPITVAEVYYGILKAKGMKQSEKNDMVAMINSFRSVPIDDRVAYRHAVLKAKSGITGASTDADLWIVAFGEELGLTVITSDTKLEHLKRFVGTIEILHVPESERRRGKR